MRFFITGATGFVGSHIAKVLIARGHTVRALIRPGRTRPINALSGVPHEIVEGDLDDLDSLAHGMNGADGVFHVAAHLGMAPDEKETQTNVNVRGTANVVTAALRCGVPRMVHTSSVAAVGIGDRGASVDEKIDYNWPSWLQYMASKRDAEAEVHSGIAKGLNAVIVNPATVFGPGDVYMGNGMIFQQVARGLLRAVPDGGMTTCDVRDVAAGHWAAFERGRTGERYILGGESLPFRDVVRIVATTMGVAGPRITVPAFATDIAGRIALGVEALGLRLPVLGAHLRLCGRRYYHSSQKATGELGYRWRSFETTVRDSVAWYRKVGLL